MIASTVFELLASLSHSQSSAELQRRMQSALLVHPELPLTWAHITGETQLDLGEWSRSPEEAEIITAFSTTLRNLYTALSTLELQTKACHLIREFVGRNSTDGLKPYARDCCELFDLHELAGLSVQQGQLQRVPEWDIGHPHVPELGAETLTLVRTGKVLFSAEGVLLPLGGKFRARAAFWLAAPGRLWTELDRELLCQMAKMIGLEYEKMQDRQHSQTLLALHRDLLGGHPEQSYQLLLERALLSIPGAECGSLLILDGDTFRFRAAITFDSVELKEIGFSIDYTRNRWYGLGEEAWMRGTPRVQHGHFLAEQAIGYEYRGQQYNSTLPSVATIRSNIGVPILYQGEVYAFLNIDSLTDPDAFAEDSVELAHSFGVQASLLLHEARLRAEVQSVARTDVLTGLMNRRAFSELMQREIAVARRDHRELALLIADIRNFKAVNDTFGHAAGDQALIQVGQIMCRTLQSDDPAVSLNFLPPARVSVSSAQWATQAGLLVFRWGGDEFAILLPETGLAQAQAVKENLQAATRRARILEQPLELNIGVAVLQEHDHTGELLLHEADKNMYSDKKA